MPRNNYRQKADFTGMATAYGVECADGLVIDPGAFDHQDGMQVPLVWQHGHGEPGNVLGHGFLKAVKGVGMRIVDSVFNTTTNGQKAKQLVKAKDIQFLSIWANGIKLLDNHVKHGNIVEVSLALGGKNPGARIDERVVHGDSPYDEDFVVPGEYIIHSGIQIEVDEDEEEGDEVVVEHAEVEETARDILATFTDEQWEVASTIIYHAVAGLDSEPVFTVDDPEAILASLSEKQTNVLHSLVGEALSNEGENDMTVTHNAFEEGALHGSQMSEGRQTINTTLQHAIEAGATSMREFFIAHAGSAIDDIDLLFPEARNVRTGEPIIYTERNGWVEMVMNAVSHSPFSRIKSTYVDTTIAEAIARGYITEATKYDSLIRAFKRLTIPQTIYHKMKEERDNIIDVTDFDVFMFIKKIQRMKLRERIARAVLIGDGLAADHDDKILEDHVRPIWGDDAAYVTHVNIDVSGAATAREATLQKIDAIAAARLEYRGSGSPKLYIATDLLTEMILVRTVDGLRIHRTEAELASALRVSEIVEVPVMTNGTAIMVNLADYTVGADRGGQTSFFDDFDLNINRMLFLLETRISAALVVPKCAVTIDTTYVAP